jgi:1,4-dihydroxy-2-naphthoate polyprenyltransferase
MPVFLFAVSQATVINWRSTSIAFLIMHLLIFPSSNGYNSYQDRDETSIGGLKHPPKVTENLFYATLMLDLLGLFCALFVSAYFFVFVLLLVLVSRAYSYRKIRLKKFPVIGFLTVFLFQGAFTYLIASSAIATFSFGIFFTSKNIICMSVASLFIGSIYPLTQIYQHEADYKDGVISLSYKLGYLGTFAFSAILFLIATVLLFYYFILKHQQISMIIFLVVMLPVLAKFLIWFDKVHKDTMNANFENTMSMNLWTSSCMNLYFLILILNKYYVWFQQ